MHEHKFLYQKMSAVQIEYSGYALEENLTDHMINRKGGEYTFQGEKLIVSYGAPFKINFKGNETIIDVAFMEERSLAYNNINKIWDETKAYTETSEIEMVVVFDDKIFIITGGLNTRFGGSVGCDTPYVLYYYDIDADTVYYCGFYSGKLNEYKCYEGFLGPAQRLKIIKEENYG